MIRKAFNLVSARKASLVAIVKQTTTIAPTALVSMEHHVKMGLPTILVLAKKDLLVLTVTSISTNAQLILVFVAHALTL